MGGGRTPCCDKAKVKTGPWSAAEDSRLVAFIREHGHSNWRALPKQAGLLRCGKSCRLRWINYLRPDVKRGNFTPQEEQAIIDLHNSLGNKWSKIASHLPGRTDNEIKNVWNTYLKKRAMATARKTEANSSSSSASQNPEFNTKSAKQEKPGDIIIGHTPRSQAEEVRVSYSSPSSSSVSNASTSQRQSQGSESGKIEIESEFDDAFWTMLDSMDTGCSTNVESVGREDELGKWLSFFESELGLDGGGDPPHREEEILQPAPWDWPPSPLWPSSPLFLDFQH